METSKEFEILIRRKMPFISSFLLWVIIILLFFLCMLNFVMYPATHSKSSLELVFSYYNLVVPNTLKVLSFYSFIGFIIVVPLYFKIRKHKPGKLTFEEDRLLITAHNVYIDIPRIRIERIYCNDLMNVFREPRGILQIVIKNEAGWHTAFRLKNYEKGGELIDKLETMNSIKLMGYENEIVLDHDEE